MSQCAVCGVSHKAKYLTALGSLGPLRAAILEQHPHLHLEDPVCYSCTSKFRTAYIQEVLSKEKGELSKLEESVLEMLHDQELQMQSLLGTEEEHLTLGDRIADQVAAFGGSWRFILLFGSVLLLWVVVNSVPVLFKPFDPYPFILMNLFLSLVAAMQAPVIMMSQNRAAARDRLQSERDFRTNLMAELEIRQLHQKLDHLITNQWQRLLEIQQLQTDMMEEMVGRKNLPTLPRASAKATKRRGVRKKRSKVRVLLDELEADTTGILSLSELESARDHAVGALEEEAGEGQRLEPA